MMWAKSAPADCSPTALGAGEVEGRFGDTPISADMKRHLELGVEKRWARLLIHQLAPNARAPTWWFTDEPINIIASAVMSRGKPE